MGNLTISLKKFLQNKNTVTVVGAILAIIVLYVAYTIRVRSSINPVSVPYATEKIYSGTQITNDQVGTVQVPPSMLNVTINDICYCIIRKRLYKVLIESLFEKLFRRCSRG